MTAVVSHFGLIIVGGGPGGLAPLLAAHRNSRLNALLGQGVAVIEAGAGLGAGAIGGYGINSDSSGQTFADCLINDDGEETPLTRLADHELTKALVAAGDGAVKLADAGRFLAVVGEALSETIGRHPASCVMTGTRALSARREAGLWHVTTVSVATGARRVVTARSLVLATGAHQPAARLDAERIGGIRLSERCAGKLLQSGDVLAQGGIARVRERLGHLPFPRVAIIGGSTSAAAVAHALLNRMPDTIWAPGSVTLMHRRPLRIYYPDRAAALAEGYAEWTEDDICPISGRVFRFAGFRLDSRELVMQARGIGGRTPDKRLVLHALNGDEATTAGILDRADLVMACLGYRPRALPVQGADGTQIRLLAQTGPQMPMVDGQCRILDAQGLPIPDLYGIGLAAGFLPRGRLGGEPSFRGQANGLWLWQHDVGALIVDAVLGSTPSAPVALPVPEAANANLPLIPALAEAD